MSAIQQSTFAPVTAYDAPNVLFTQLLEDEATFESFLDTFLDDSQLTPKQRDSYVDRLKAEYGGGNKAQEALIGVATNPLVLLGFLVSPQIGRNLANKGQAFQHFLKGADGLSFMALKNFKQLFQNTPLDPALRQVANSVRKSNRIFDDIMVPAEETFIAKNFGITRNQFHDTLSIPDKQLRTEVERFKRLFVADMDGQLTSSTDDQAQFLRGMTVRIQSRDGTSKRFGISSDVLRQMAQEGNIGPLERKALTDAQAFLNSENVLETVRGINSVIRARAERIAQKGVTGAKQGSLFVDPAAYQGLRDSAALEGSLVRKTLTPDEQGSILSILRESTKRQGKGRVAGFLKETDDIFSVQIEPQYSVSGKSKSVVIKKPDPTGAVDPATGTPKMVEEQAVLFELGKDQGFLTNKGSVARFAKARGSGGLVDKSSDVRLALQNRYQGYEDFRSSVTQALDTNFVRTYGREGVTVSDIARMRQLPLVEREREARRLIDPNKLLRVKDGLQNRSNFGTTEGDMFIDRLLSPQTRNRLLTGKLKEKDFQNEMVRGFAATVVSNYLPRNSTEFFKVAVPRISDPAVDTLSTLRGRLTPLAPDEGPSFRLGQKQTEGRLVATNREYQRQGRQVLHPDDIDALEGDFQALGIDPRVVQTVDVKLAGGGTKTIEIDIFEKMREAAQKQIQLGQDEIVGLRRLDLSKTLFRTRSQTARDYALFIEQPGQNVISAQRAIIPQVEVTYGKSKLPGGYSPTATERPELMSVFSGEAKYQPPGGFHLAHVLEQGADLIAYGGSRDPNTVARGVKARELLNEVALPKALGVSNERTGLSRLVIGTAQAQAKRMEGSSFMNGIGKMGPLGKSLKEQVEYFANAETGALASSAKGTASGYLYTSHLGLNVASVIQNLTQPFLHASAYLGVGNVLRGYKGTFDDLYRYAQNRQKIKSLQLTPYQKERLIQDSFEFPDETGLTTGILDDLDRLVVNRGMEVSKFKFYTQELPMLLFEKGEWVNRITATHAMKSAYVKNGLATKTATGRVRFSDPGVRERFARDASFLVEETQFGSDVLNTPILFMEGASKVVNTPSFLSNPLIRQFQTFSLRAPLAYMFTGRMLGATRGIRGTSVEVPYLAGDMLRMMGTSALIYEAGKPFAFDPSAGGAATAMTQFFNPERLAEGKFPMRGPPIVSISTDSLQGLLGGDMDLVVNAAVRTLPGGLAIQRAMGSMPNLRDDPFTSFIGQAQKTYADYSAINSDGRVPVYKGTGQLVDYQSPTEMVLRGLGLNMAGARATRDIDGYISSQREKFNMMRRSYLDRLFANDVGKAEAIRNEFKRTYGFDLPVTKSQVDAYIRQREIPRSERMMDRLPVELKTYFRQTLDPERLQLTRQQLNMRTSFERSAQQAERAPVAVTPELAARLQQEIAQTEQQRQLFEAFEGF